MRVSTLSLIPVALLVGTAGAASPSTERGQQELAKLLSGRVAGPPTDCIRTYPSSANEMRVIDGTAIVFGRGETIYVNRTRDPSSLNDRDAFLVKKYGIDTQLCRTDVVTTFDRSAHFYTGNVFLAEFVPYRRTR